MMIAHVGRAERERELRCSTICAPVSMVFVAADIRRSEDSRAAPPRPPPLTRCWDPRTFCQYQAYQSVIGSREIGKLY